MAARSGGVAARWLYVRPSLSTTATGGFGANVIAEVTSAPGGPTSAAGGPTSAAGGPDFDGRGPDFGGGQAVAF